MAGRQPVDAPSLRPPDVSLLTSVPVAELAGGHWGLGVDYEDQPCGTEVQTYPLCASSPYPEKNDPEDADVKTSDPFAVVGPEGCSTFGSLARPFVERARSLLLACEAKAVEGELWTTTITGNPQLAAGGAVTDLGGPFPAADAIGRLEQAASDLGCGHGVIHVSRRAVPHLTLAGAVGRVEAADVPASLTVTVNAGGDVEPVRVGPTGPLLLTTLGTVVIPGGGYPGTGPAGQVPAAGATYMYLSGAVEILRGPVVTYPTELGPESIEPLTNDINFWAERPYVLKMVGCPLAVVLATLVSP